MCVGALGGQKRALELICCVPPDVSAGNQT